MNPPSNLPTSRRDRLVCLARELGREDRGLAILGEGNVSTRDGETAERGGFLVKASGRTLATLAPEAIVACRAAGLLALMDSGGTDEQIAQALLASRADPREPKPSVEAIFHAYLLSLPGVEWVGHTHCTAVNRILCSPRAAEFAARRMCPDEVVCCGPRSAYMGYVDPGLKLAVEIRREVRTYMEAHGSPPRVILLGNHGVITLGATESAVLAAMMMTRKAAQIWLGAALLGGPVYLSEADVARIAGRTDEHERQRALNL